MDAILRLRNDFYLLFDKAYLKSFKTHEFRKRLGKRFPAIQQIISHDAANAKAQDFYIDGLNSGDIDQQIFEIYTRIHELAQ